MILYLDSSALVKPFVAKAGQVGLAAYPDSLPIPHGT